MTSYFLLDKILIPKSKLQSSVSLLSDKCTRVICLKEESGRTNGETQVCSSFLRNRSELQPSPLFFNKSSFFLLTAPGSL